MQTEPSIAFAERRQDGGLDVRVNFGVFAGREATAAELDDLARALVQELGEVSVVAEQRLEVTENVEASVHQVRLEVTPDRLPSDRGAGEELTTRLVTIAERWAQACIAERHTDVAEI